MELSWDLAGTKKIDSQKMEVKYFVEHSTDCYH